MTRKNIDRAPELGELNQLDKLSPARKHGLLRWFINANHALNEEVLAHRQQQHKDQCVANDQQLRLAGAQRCIDGHVQRVAELERNAEEATALFQERTDTIEYLQAQLTAANQAVTHYQESIDRHERRASEQTQILGEQRNTIRDLEVAIVNQAKFFAITRSK